MCVKDREDQQPAKASSKPRQIIAEKQDHEVKKRKIRISNRDGNVITNQLVGAAQIEPRKNQEE